MTVNLSSKKGALLLVSFALGLLIQGAAMAQTVCAEVKIEIAQELTIERQAFEATLRIENTFKFWGQSKFSDLNLQKK